MDAVFVRLKQPAIALIDGIIRDRARSEEICQDAFLKAWEKRETFRGTGTLDGWIMRIARNLALDELRSAGRRITPESRFHDNREDEESWESFIERHAENPFPAPEEGVLDRERRTLLEDAAENLPEEKRALFDLVYARKLSLKTAAATLGIPYGTAKSRWHYSVKKLNAVLDDYEGDE